MASSSESWGRGPNNDGPPGVAGSAAAGRPRRDEVGALGGCGSVTSGRGAREPLRAPFERLLAAGSAVRGPEAPVAPAPLRELPERRLLAEASLAVAGTLADRSDLLVFGREEATSERLDGRWFCPRWLSERRLEAGAVFSDDAGARERGALDVPLLAGARRLERGSLARRRPRPFGRSWVSHSG